ncbi:MAG: PPC domain-containing DNA-binding protein [Candidatus Muiribacteriota bacterium]
MQVKKINSGYILAFKAGERVIQKFDDFCRQNNIRGGIFNGIGAFDYLKLGHFNITTQRYMEKVYRESLEVISIKGNITEKEGEPFIHMHTTVSDSNFNVYGGHLIEAEVSVTLEVYIRVFEEKIIRKFDEKTGLFLIE